VPIVRSSSLSDPVRADRIDPPPIVVRGSLRAAVWATASLAGVSGIEAFADRARGELLATGERVRGRTKATLDELTS
jgi:hypothetical protein